MKEGTRRLDQELVSRGLAPTREKARALIMAGEVRVNDQLCDRAHRTVSGKDQVTVRIRYPFASRGAFKLERALEAFQVDPAGRAVLDVGISNGGFADLMLQRGARRVVGVDVNIAQVDVKLRRDPRVTLLQGNARHLDPRTVDPPPDIITLDLSFISVTKVMPALSAWPGALVLCLIKPQFEAERHRVRKGGVIRDPEERLNILLRVQARLEEINWRVTGVCPAGVKGRKGNQEYFFRLEYGKGPGLDARILADVVSL